MTRTREDILEYQRKYRAKHKAARQVYDRLRYSENKCYFANKNDSYYADHKDEILTKSSSNYKANKDKVKVNRRLYMRGRRHKDVFLKLHEFVSKRIHSKLKRGKSTLECLPYTIEELKKHLESKFESWMTWDNYGTYRVDIWKDNDRSTWSWQIDHIIPRSRLPYYSLGDDNFTACWALSNLRPLSSKHNILKGSK